MVCRIGGRRKSDDRENYKEARELLYSAFPPDELILLHLLILFTFIKKASFLAFYDNEKFVGLAYKSISKVSAMSFTLPPRRASEEADTAQEYSTG